MGRQPRNRAAMYRGLVILAVAVVGAAARISWTAGAIVLCVGLLVGWLVWRSGG